MRISLRPGITDCRCQGEVPDTWLHTELHASNSDERVLFELSWMTISEAKECLSDSDCLLLDAATCQSADK